MIHRHLVLTRFSIKAAPDAAPLPAAWLEDRLRLFDAYCVPSLAAQTRPDFGWRVLCDRSTPGDVVDRVGSLVAEVPGAAVVLTETGRSPLEAILEAVDAETEVLTTTRLDSDDALDVGFAERVAEYVPSFAASRLPTLLLNFSQGYKLAADRSELYESFQPLGPYMTLFERIRAGATPRTVQSGNHGFLNLTHPMHCDASRRAWLQVVHAGNVSNEVQAGDLHVPMTVLDGRFELRPAAAEGRTGAPAPQPDGVEERAAFRHGLEDAVYRGEPRPPSGRAE